MAARSLNTTIHPPVDDDLAGCAEAEAGCAEDEAGAQLSLRGRAAATAVVAAAAFLMVAPALVAITAIVSPGELNRIYGWLLGGSLAFSLVAAGRVPAAALLLLVLARRQGGR